MIEDIRIKSYGLPKAVHLIAAKAGSPGAFVLPVSTIA
jgi:hypothetical protein